jgi:hypothetical protein
MEREARDMLNYMDVDYEAMWREHPESVDMPWPEAANKYWAYSPFRVASARAAALIRRDIVNPINRFAEEIVAAVSKGTK